MARTRPTSNVRPTARSETSSGTSPGEDFESPQDLSDVAGIDAEIPRPSRPSPAGLLQGKPKPRSPLGLEAGKSAGGGLGIVASVPLGGPISGRGGINLGEGGSIKGASLGLGIGLGPLGASIDVGVDQDEQGRGGCYQYVTVTVGPFSHTYGRNVCEPKPPQPQPPGGSSPGSEMPIISGIGSPSEEILPLLQDNKCYHVVILWHAYLQNEFTWTPNPNIFIRDSRSDEIHGQGVWQNVQNRFYADVVNLPYKRTPAFIQEHTPPNVPLSQQYNFPEEFKKYKANYKAWASLNGGLQIIIPNGYRYNENFLMPWHLVDTGAGIKNYINLYKPVGQIWDLSVYEIPCNPSSSTPPQRIAPPTTTPPAAPLSPPVPNPPPRKKMDDKCCQQSLLLQVEILRLLGRQVGPQGIMPIVGTPGFLGEPIKRTETPIVDGKKPKEIEIKFDSIYTMLVYALRQANDLDTALDPKSYKIPSGYIPNPEYSRDSEHSLKDNTQPNKDKNGNERELEINENDRVKMGGFLQQQEYIFAAIKRLEYLFPFGELNDALIAKDLLIPGGKGDIKIHNMIMAYEIQMMYLNATFGNPREVLTIKDANPAIEGDQPIEVAALTLSDWFRQVVKFQIDTGGDVDAAVNLMLRDFRTNLANRTDIIKTAEMTQALFEDSGMREQQDYIPIHLEGDPYAGQWVKGQGFQANPDLEKKTEEATEKVLRETMKPTEIKLKVSRRHKEEKADMRDLLRGLADFVQRLLSVPSAGDAGTAIDKLIESAKFKVQTEAALLRANVIKAATASRNRTKKRKK